MNAEMNNNTNNMNPQTSLGNSNPKYPNPSLLVDATRNDPPYNKNSYPAYDQSSYYVGKTTPLDVMDIIESSSGVSPDAMDPNWGGASYTQSLINKGYYKNNNVQINVEQ